MGVEKSCTMTTNFLTVLSKNNGKGSRYQVQLKLGTRHRKDSLHKEGEEAQRRNQGFPTHIPESKQNKRIRSKVPRDESQSECWGPVGPWL
jgi:hypothetical protein